MKPPPESKFTPQPVVTIVDVSRDVVVIRRQDNDGAMAFWFFVAMAGAYLLGRSRRGRD